MLDEKYVAFTLEKDTNETELYMVQSRIDAIVADGDKVGGISFQIDFHVNQFVGISQEDVTAYIILL